MAASHGPDVLNDGLSDEIIRDALGSVDSGFDAEIIDHPPKQSGMGKEKKRIVIAGALVLLLLAAIAGKSLLQPKTAAADQDTLAVIGKSQTIEGTAPPAPPQDLAGAPAPSSTSPDASTSTAIAVQSAPAAGAELSEAKAQIEALQQQLKEMQARAEAAEVATRIAAQQKTESTGRSGKQPQATAAVSAGSLLPTLSGQVLDNGFVTKNGVVIEIGQKFPSGRRLLAVNPAAGTITVESRTYRIVSAGGER